MSLPATLLGAALVGVAAVVIGSAGTLGPRLRALALCGGAAAAVVGLLVVAAAAGV